MKTTIATKYFADHQQQILADWFDLLRLESIGVDRYKLGECARAAAWLKQFLKPLGFEVDILTPKEGLPVPVLVAERVGDGDKPVVLMYGHYDVQPADPLEQWQTPPFEPTLVEGRVYARGAQDNKGQIFGLLQGIKALIEAGETLPTIKVVIEGQEESGSSALEELLPSLRQRLQADVLMVSDTACNHDGRPAIVAGLRGVQHFTVTLRGPDYDLHSGVHGGVAPNPAQGMAVLLASLYNADGSLAVAEFTAQVVLPTDEELELARQSAAGDEAYQELIGCPPWGGAQKMDLATRMCFWPTIEINGVHSGYGGPGSKTVIPAVATAKLSMRLVPEQRPHDTIAAVQEHLKAHCPRGMRLEFSDVSLGATGFRLPLNSPVFRLATTVLEQMDARGAVYRWEGASIPIVAQLQQVTGAAPLLVGFGREEDKIHCPNESFSLEQFQQVLTWSTLMLQAL